MGKFSQLWVRGKVTPEDTFRRPRAKRSALETVDVHIMRGVDHTWTAGAGQITQPNYPSGLLSRLGLYFLEFLPYKLHPSLLFSLTFSLHRVP